MRRSSVPTQLSSPSDHINGCIGEDLAIRSFCDASQDLVPIVDQKLIVGLEMAGIGPSR